jgi:hypothetical protein
MSNGLCLVLVLTFGPGSGNGSISRADTQIGSREVRSAAYETWRWEGRMAGQMTCLSGMDRRSSIRFSKPPVPCRVQAVETCETDAATTE